MEMEQVLEVFHKIISRLLYDTADWGDGDNSSSEDEIDVIGPAILFREIMTQTTDALFKIKIGELSWENIDNVNYSHKSYIISVLKTLRDCQKGII